MLNCYEYFSKARQWKHINGQEMTYRGWANSAFYWLKFGSCRTNNGQYCSFANVIWTVEVVVVLFGFLSPTLPFTNPYSQTFFMWLLKLCLSDHSYYNIYSKISVYTSFEGLMDMLKMTKLWSHWGQWSIVAVRTG